MHGDQPQRPALHVVKTDDAPASREAEATKQQQQPLTEEQQKTNDAPASKEAEAPNVPATELTEQEQQLLWKVETEAKRLASQSEIERSFFLKKRAADIGVPVATLKDAVAAVLNEQDRLRKDEQ
jgi:hypothetical protein